MKIELHQIKVKDVFDGYVNNTQDGSVVGYGGKLNIRPKYQREFIYKNEQRNAVIATVMKGFPLNVMYWSVNGDGTFEVMDGQQRTISLCEYLYSNFSVKTGDNVQYFFGLTDEERKKIEDYELMIYFCEGEENEKLDWFEVINIAGEELTKQELRNTVYTGVWLSDAKTKFSKFGCPAQAIGGKYLSGESIRQVYLETALKWISDSIGISIKEYMARHKGDPNANELWTYFRGIIEWVDLTFVEYRKEMKGLDWGTLYRGYHDKLLDTAELEREIQTLMIDDDVTSKKGIYSYVLTRDEKHLNIRAYTVQQKREAYERQKGICGTCGKHFELAEMDGDHITPWIEGGRTNTDNCQMLCRECNRRKGSK